MSSENTQLAKTHVGLGVEQYAELLARHHAGEPSASILRPLGMDAADWPLAQQLWKEEIEASIERGDDVLVTRFAAAYAETRAQLRSAPAPSREVEPRRQLPVVGSAPILAASSPAFGRSPWAAPPHRRAAAGIGATFHAGDATSDALPTLGDETLPFKAPEEDAPERAATSDGRVAGAGTDTGTGVLGTYDPGANETLPFVKTTPEAPSAGLDLEQYAALCAALSAFPDEAPEALRRYGVRDEAARRALDTEWSARLASDSQLRSSWEQHSARARARLLARR